MGGTSWSDDHYSARSATRRSKGIGEFDYSHKVATGVLPKASHVDLDPAKLKAGKREVRDSETHPESVPVFIGLDVTGSMSSVPKKMQAKLPLLLGLLLRKGYLSDPAICISAIGDAKYDAAPLQISQFESGVEIDDEINKLYLEGGGGGNMHESYELALYFLARCVASDNWEKRGKKGYAFIICDEEIAEKVSASEVKKVFGESSVLQDDIQIKDLMKEVLERWELYCIIPNMTSHYDNPRYSQRWKELLGERVLHLTNPEGISELIASTIGVLEDNDISSITEDLTSEGVDASIVNSVTKSLATVNADGSLSTYSTKGTGLATL